jgi:hypothetical protein
MAPWRKSAYGAVKLVRLVPYPVTEDGSQLQDSTISAEPPGLKATRAWYGAGAVAGLSAGAVMTGAVSPGLGLPLTLATVVALALGYRRRKGVVTEAWRHRHRVLHHAEDTRAFATARQASEQVVDAWPRIGAMVGVADPGPALARSLWTLSEVLVSRSALRDQRDELEQIHTDLPTGTEVWRDVDDRVVQLATALSALDTEVHARAIARAREAVQRADQVLGDTLAPVDGALEPGHELADRTAAVLDAYRELTRHPPS